jgi:hypothetical protein
MITYFDCMNVQMLLEWIRMVVELRRMTNLNDIEELTQCEELIEERSFKVKKGL